MKRTRKWAYVAQEAQRLADLGLSPLEISRRLDLSKSTVTRWMKEGKLPRTKGEGPKARPLVETPTSSPSEWAAAIRAEHQLDATDDQIVALAEGALGLARDTTVSAAVRLQAGGRFQALVRQLAVRTAAQPKPQADAPPAEPERKVNPVVSRAGGDPRLMLVR